MAIATIGLSDRELTAALDDLFAEGETGARGRENTAYDLAAGLEKKPLVLFGAGQLGRITLAGLRRLGAEPIAFTDNNPLLWNTKVDGVLVLSPREAAQLHGDRAIFIVTIWRGKSADRMPEREATLRSIGCRHVITFQPLFWKHPEIFLPHYAVDLPHRVHERTDDVRRAGHLWEDDASRGEYLAQLRWRVLGDFNAMPDPVEHTIYFPKELCSLTDREVFVDCGAYDGDSIQSFLEESTHSFTHIYGFEPDPANFAKLQERISQLPERDSISVRRAAVGASAGVVTFSGEGSEASRVGSGDMQVDCVVLDEILAGIQPTYIKMDIEGSELEALTGARGIIERDTPVLAICTYHVQDHLWKIPLLIRQFSGDYAFFLRPHLLEGWDLVTYAIPKHRLARG
jgi:FkbM family methyltransferase